VKSMQQAGYEPPQSPQGRAILILAATGVPAGGSVATALRAGVVQGLSVEFTHEAVGLHRERIRNGFAPESGPNPPNCILQFVADGSATIIRRHQPHPLSLEGVTPQVESMPILARRPGDHFFQ